MSQYLAFLKTNIRIIAPAALVIVIASLFALRSDAPAPETTRLVQTALALHADVSDASSFTGTLEPVRSVDIAAKTGGLITALSVDVGVRVGAGQVIAQLDSSQARATVASLTDSIAAAQATLDATDALYTQQIQSAQSAGVGDAQTATVSALTDAAILAKQIDETLGNTFSLRAGASINNASPFPESDLSARDGQAKITARAELAEFQIADATFQSYFDTTILSGNPTDAQVADAVAQASTLLSRGKTALSAAYTALSATVSSASVSASTIDSTKASIASLGTQAQALLSRLHDTTSGLDTLKKERDAKVAEAQAQITQLQGQLQVSQVLLVDGTVRAPFSGVITEKPVERGAVVGAGTPLVHLVDDSQLKLVVGVPDTSTREYRVGDTAAILLDSGASVSARISKINPAVDPNSRKVLVELSVANPGRTIVPGTYARAVFEKSHVAQVAVPRAAVYTQYGVSSVFVLESGIAQRRIVEIGAQSEDLVEIKSGVAAGETVVTSGVSYLRDGDALTTEATE